jgi:hypothetical protein
VQELTVERQVLRKVFVDLLCHSPIAGFFNWVLFSIKCDSAIVGFWCPGAVRTVPCVLIRVGRWISVTHGLFHYPRARSVNFCSTCANPFRSVKFSCTWATPKCSLGIMFNLLDSLEVVIWIFHLLSYGRDYVSSRLYIVLGWILFTHTCLFVVGFYSVSRYLK